MDSLLALALKGAALGASLALASTTPSPSPEPTVGIGTPSVVLNCPEGTVPGWLDEWGNPTSCVNNEPNPGGWTPEPTPSAEPARPAPATPTYTG